MKRHLLSAAAVVGLVMGAADPVCAQSIDYGSLEQLFNEPVTTSATGSPQRVTETPADMTIITQEDIRRSGAKDLPTILSRVPGVDVLNWSAGHTDVSVRGYDQIYSPRLLVLIDGRQVYLDDYGYTAWGNLPVTLAEIRQIEVVRGPNSALFGFNAVGGVINIITRNPRYDDTNSLEMHGGTQSDRGGSAVGTLHFGDRASMRVSVGADRQKEWENDLNAFASWNAHSMADLAVQLSPKTELRLQGSLAGSRSEDMVPSSNYVPARYKTSSIMATLTSETPYGELQARTYLNSLDDRDASPIGLFHFKNQVAVASLQDLFKIGTRNTARLAVEYRNNRENTTPEAGGHVSYDLVGASAMWSFAASNRLSLTLAGRLDHLMLKRSGTIPPGFLYASNALWDRTTDTFSANAGIVYEVSDRDTLRATYGRGIQSPTLDEYGGLQLVLSPGPYGPRLGGNPFLRPSVISNYQLSYDRVFESLDAKASLKAFVQHTDDVKGLWDFAHPLVGSSPPYSFEAVFANASRSTMGGFELSASGKVQGGFHWSADTTYTHIKDTPLSGENLIGRQVAFGRTSPRFRGNVAAGWADRRWAVDGFVHYVSAYGAYNAAGALERSPAYATLAARAGYTLSPGLTLAVSGQNLGHGRQVQGLESGLKAERRVLVSLSKTW